MEQDSLVFRVVTPMVLTGQDGRTPELRGASFRGILRWWFRALAGKYLADPEVLRNYENRLFGGPVNRSDKVETNGSSFTISVGRISIPDEGDGYKQPLLPHKGSKGQQSWVSCFPIETCFELNIAASHYIPAELDKKLTHAVELIKAILDVAACLGGIGKRSRRTFGSFQPIFWRSTSHDAVVAHIGKTIAKADQLVRTFIEDQTDLGHGGQPTYTASSISPFPVLNANVATVKVGDSIPWKEPETQRQANADWFLTELMRECSSLKHQRSPALGDGRPRQASTLLVSIFKPLSEDENDRFPVYTQFYCKTVQGARRRSDFDSIAQMPASLSENLKLVSF